MKRINKLIQLAGFGIVVAIFLFVQFVVEWKPMEIIEVINQLF